MVMQNEGSRKYIDIFAITQKRAQALARNDFFGSDKQINFFVHIYIKFLPFRRIHDVSVLSNRLDAYLGSNGKERKK